MRYYGSLQYGEMGGKNWWRIECEPQVAARLKRVFEKASKNPGPIYLSDSAEHARELSWFMERYPLRVAPQVLEYLATREREHLQEEDDVSRIVSSSYKPRPVRLAIEARKYQLVASDLALRTGGLLVADDVGLGKTCTAICTFASPARRPALVVTLTHLPRQWRREIDRFLPGLKIHILKKGTMYRLPDADIIISNYHKLSGWADAFAGKFRTVVFDEAHELRRVESYKYTAATAIARRADVVMGLTATPIMNYGNELFNVMSVIKPGVLGTREEFTREWGARIVPNPKELGAYLLERGSMIRRTRRDVGRELPKLTISTHEIEANLYEIEKVATPAMELASFLLQEGGKGIDKLQAAEELSWRLRQATGIAKAPFVADFVRLLVESGEKVVLYGWHKAVYRIWTERLQDLGMVMYTGDESPHQKEESLKSFIEGDAKVLVISLRAGAGIDGLQNVCRTVVFGEIDWSHSIHEQSTGRIYRDGQPDPVVAYFLLADVGSDPVVSDVLGLKKVQLEGIRNPKGTVVQESQVDPARVRRLALDFLKQRGKMPQWTPEQSSSISTKPDAESLH